MHNIYYLGLSGEHCCPLGYLFSSPEPKAHIELLVYRGVRRPSSKFSNDFFSEAAGPILLISHI